MLSIPPSPQSIASRAANTPTPHQLAQQLLASKRESIAAQHGRVPLPVQISDV
tara:strand:- start:9 stop:167 length:159 start_codon:yes stop_codon:yes gene_type:complete